MLTTDSLLPLDRQGSRMLATAAGHMEILVDPPARPPIGMAIVAHPQPMLGGSATHKVPQFLAHALRDAGWLALRPNFRGVGNSSGAHDQGVGETSDMRLLHGTLRASRPDLPIALVGFSFGAFVMARLARELAEAGTPAWRSCLAGMPYGDIRGQCHYDTPRGIADALVIHGESDERVPLSAILEWARPDTQPVTVIPGANHFFTGRLPALRTLVLAHLAI